MFLERLPGDGQLFFIQLLPMKINTTSNVIITTYLLAEIFLLLFVGAYFLILTNIADWEIFAYNFYGSMVIFGLSCLTALLLRFIFKISSNVVVSILLFILPEIIGWFITKDSLYLSVFKNDTSYILIYPFSVLIAFTAVAILAKNSK
ncbi:hypothetical protein Q765_06415 [Flavobacterium rivuli WB 3.3-2 = DSM 21788]|uniref:ABC transporter permease n=1 Tax=Flavobacterium rivuli WB 3.3-2 = DSM 21788 TaxID=1121895 RepID=A0A0A2M6Q2_9FLAO|nr:hypothetical protein Q765_06415 [Flavobacterium rivuli WB 3.3-2 = DSM 21788]